jgi:hypothetical protein
LPIDLSFLAITIKYHCVHAFKSDNQLDGGFVV